MTMRGRPSDMVHRRVQIPFSMWERARFYEASDRGQNLMSVGVMRLLVRPRPIVVLLEQAGASAQSTDALPPGCPPQRPAVGQRLARIGRGAIGDLSV